MLSDWCSKKRQAISPVLATVLLIAITLIAATAVSGFVFGLFGTFTSVAQVSAGTVTCSGTPEVCAVGLQNTGSGNVAITGICQMNFGGNNYLSNAVLVSGSLDAGKTATVNCTIPTSAHALSGTQVTGWIVLGNGADVLYVGTAA